MTTAQTDENILRRRFTAPGSFLVGVLLFLAPFVVVKCNGVEVAHNSGLGLAIGKDFKMSGEYASSVNSLEKMFSSDEVKTSSKKTSSQGKMYEVALAALILGVIGVLATYSSARSSALGMILGAAAAICLIVLMVQVNSDVKPAAADPDVPVKVSFTLWYYLSVIAFLIGAFASYQRQKAVSPPVPPPHAPQVPLNNPGDQSEFPKSASESEIG